MKTAIPSPGPRRRRARSQADVGIAFTAAASPVVWSERDVHIPAGLGTRRAGAFIELMNAYRWKVYGIAYQLTKDHHEAENMVQETFLRAFLAGPRFRGEGSFATWLHTIVTNIARNRSLLAAPQTPRHRVAG